MKVAVIGTGYVGLVAGAAFAETGNDVICVDINEERIIQLKKGKIPIYEPGLESLVINNSRVGRLTFTTDTVDAVSRSLVIFMAVPTPSGEDGSADLQHVLSAAKEVAKGINEYKVIVDKSTVPVGTAAKVKKVISEITDQPFDVVSNPEFLKEGAAVDDFMKPDRVVLGCDSKKAEDIMSDLYAPFVRTVNRIITMRVTSAELTKYTANAFLATKISFINEIARLCELVDADINEVRSGIGSDSRIGQSFLFPGIGFGGSCFPKDLRAINFTADNHDLQLQLVKAAIDTNAVQKQFIPTKIKKYFKGDLNGLNIAVWGLAFKANTDDVRESPVIPIIDSLLEGGANVLAYDPQAMETAKEIFGDRINYTQDSYSALKDADALVVATEWNEFRHPDFARMSELMRKPVIFDGRNLFNPPKMVEFGFTYFGVGRSLTDKHSA
ncbi:MAG: UDP-glucose/GDP-mannose dehydrogenase family protein [Calditrichaeota bacterium]|jgi:UDPglucose 6-dehydrogenase|nr:UDP-glucose/GDP-mannose dehydrogenase family protein [Calditrichota bacterium]MBT7787314.1 UDP-glucose/GDP-mannose dehydrogenase family protein [Calditrichota bacterium]